MKSSPMPGSLLLRAAVFFLPPLLAQGGYFTFLLNGQECFFEHVEENTASYVMVALLSESESHRLDFVGLSGPQFRRLYRDVKYEHIEFTANITGEYRVCVVSTDSWGSREQKVFFNWHKGDEPMFTRGIESVANNESKALTLMETATASIRKNLNIAEDQQMRERHRFARGLWQAHFLNERVMWWSAGQAVVVVLGGVLQVFLLRRFFTVTKQQL